MYINTTHQPDLSFAKLKNSYHAAFPKTDGAIV